MLPQILMAVAAACLVDNKITPLGLGKLNPLNSLLPPTGAKALPPATDNVPHPGTPATPVPDNIPGNTTGIFRDAQGRIIDPATGLPRPGVNPGGNGLDPTSLNAAAQAALAAMMAQQAAQGKPVPTGADAAQAAEDMKNKIMNALSTPTGDRTPEQLALLQSIGSLPTLAAR